MASRVYDASAFYAGVPFSSQEQGFTTNLVFDEIKHIKKSQGAIEILLQTGRLRIMDPDTESTKSVLEEAKRTGDIQELSGADISAVALAYQLRGQILTDDFAVSNISKHMKIPVHPIMTDGIKKVARWAYRCPACQKQFQEKSHCPICGSKLQKKLL